jgi:hypothetical protein
MAGIASGITSVPLAVFDRALSTLQGTTRVLRHVAPPRAFAAATARTAATKHPDRPMPRSGVRGSSRLGQT